MLHATRFGRQLLTSGGQWARSAVGLSTHCKSLVLEQHGCPEEALHLKETELSSELLGDHDVLVNILAAPINPSDINTIEGKYPLKPALPGIPGHEGVGTVVAVGGKVTRMRVGDRVVPIEHSQGTWRSHGVFHEAHWYKIPKDLPIATAATMVINPPTALRLLEEFVTLQPGDTVIQTGATSAVGKYVIQLAQQRGVHTINIVRDRSSRPEVEKELKELGATVVGGASGSCMPILPCGPRRPRSRAVRRSAGAAPPDSPRAAGRPPRIPACRAAAQVCTAEEAPGALEVSGLDRPKLALDCVCGPAGTAVAKLLEPGGTVVVYGAMSKQPLSIPPHLLIFQAWAPTMKEGWKVKEQLADRVCALFRQKVIKPVPVDCMPLEQWQDALKRAKEGFRDCKVGWVLLTNYPEDACV
eukprot:scaffold14.g1202.t1